MPSRRLCAVLLACGALSLMAGGLALYAQRTMLSERAFAGRATAALGEDEVRDEIVDRIGMRMVQAHPELAEQRPLIDSAAQASVVTPAFAAEFHRGAARFERELFHDGRAPATLVVPGAGPALVGAVKWPSGPGAPAVPTDDPVLFTIGGRVGAGPLELTLRRAAPPARRLAALAPVAIAVGVVLLTLAVLRAPTRRRGLRRAALAVAAVGGVTLAALTIAHTLLLSTFTTSHGHAVVNEIWSVFLGDLRAWALLAGVVGLVLAAALDPGRPGAWRRALAWLAQPPGSAARAARAAALLVVAVLLLAAPQVPLELGLIGLAGLFVFTAAAELVRLRPLRQPADY
jgi:hypothetical protein